METISKCALVPIDPAAIPQRTLWTGAKMPGIGMGTFGSDHVSTSKVAVAVSGAAAVGYRHLDCASVYAKEAEIGAAFEEIFRNGIRREDLWITSKLWNDKHSEDDVISSCMQSLADLRLKYLDLYLVHWPFPNFHPLGCDVSSRSPDAKPYIHENYMRTWRKMEELVEMGLVRHIGTSNMTISSWFCATRASSPRSMKWSCTRASSNRNCSNSRSKAAFNPPVIVPSARRGSRSATAPPRTPRPPYIPSLSISLVVTAFTPPLVCIKWAVQRGQPPIPFSVNHYYANLAGIVGLPLSSEEMQAIASLDRNCRLIKGQVFLWKSGQTWEALWDLNGEIAPP
jgi:alcohol dehydrogenase (NADP+)